MANITKPMFLQVGAKRYQVATFQQASEMFCKARDASGLGGSKIKTPLLVGEAGEVVGYVSYNGRVWAGSPQEWAADRAPLYDNGSGLRS
jgi:hypothetical protein